MEDLVLTASDDHVARLAHEGDPVRAIIELIWNAVDAEATSVVVTMERSSMDAIDQVRVEDDGHGISSDEVASTFGRIGGSWKSLSEKSKNGKRYLHGKLGEGRLRAFALGSRVSWVSVSDNTIGQREQITITGSRSSRDRFRWDATPSTAASTGTVVTAHNDEQRSLSALEADGVLPQLRSHFAPLLLNDQSLTITYDGSALDPSQEVVNDTTSPLPFGENGENEAVLRIIEWRSGKHRAVSFGPDADHFPYETSGTPFENRFTYSAYVTWNKLGIDELAALGLGDMAPDAVGELWTAAREAIRDHFNARRRERRREQVEHWKETGVYP